MPRWRCLIVDCGEIIDGANDQEMFVKAMTHFNAEHSNLYGMQRRKRRGLDLPTKRGKEAQYRSISLPTLLWDKIEAAVNSGKYGYQNVPDFVLDSVRKRLRERGLLE
ncbi:MAG: hypothetical protein ACHQ03_10105 [Candidatus Bathyarchaeia archaeon]